MKRLGIIMELLFPLFCFLIIIMEASSIGSSYGHQLLVNCLASDREALLDFKSGLQDPHNVLSSWSGANCCEWYGIRCNNNTGAVDSIDLHNPYVQRGRYESYSDSYEFDYDFDESLWSLSGNISPSLMKLKSLRHLDLSFNQFNGIPIPDLFGSLENLQYLNLSHAGFRGTIPPNLRNLSHLEILDLHDFGLYVADLQWLRGLISLEHLVMNEVNLSLATDWFSTLNQLPSIVELHLSYCELFGNIPSPTTSLNFTSLAVIDLSYNNFRSVIPDWFVNISSLQYIDMSHNKLYGRIPLGLGELPNLLSLDLSYNHNLTASCSQLFSGRWEKIQMLDLSVNKLHGKLPSSLGNMTSLTHFDLSDNAVEGGIPSSIGKLCNLNSFDLAWNKMKGSLPEFLEGIDSCSTKDLLPLLERLMLSYNQLVGKFPYWLGQLENLKELDLSNNQLSGIVSETHFSKLIKLKRLDLSSNSLIINVSSNWIPPFQVHYLLMDSCVLGPSFPTWVKSQKELTSLGFSNASISGSIPNWFWDFPSNLTSMSISHNKLHGQLPNPLPTSQLGVLDLSFNLLEGPINFEKGGNLILDLSHNHFSGPIPYNLSESQFRFVSLSDNHLSGELHFVRGGICNAEILDLSSNKLSGRIHSSIGNCSNLVILDLRSNSLSGTIPNSLGQLQDLETLHLSENQLSGKLPSSFINLSYLKTMDLGNNQFSGEIPVWFGDGFSHLRILVLRSNSFTGEILFDLSKLNSLQVLDLADNYLNGSIPPSLCDLKTMSQEQRINTFFGHGMPGKSYEESLDVNMKGMFLKYTKTLSLVTSIDLSRNNLSGRFPQELTKLSGLVALNLSINHLTGIIPESISNMHQLSSLDLSSNHFSGSIPPSLSSLSFLGYLNLSDNSLSGAIPYTGHMTTFEAPSYAGNPGLCGLPLPFKCPGDDDDPKMGASNEENDGDDDDGFIDKWFYLSLGLGFAVGLLVPYLILAMKRSWSDVYFDFVDLIIYKLLVKIHRRRINNGRKSNKLRHRR